MIATVGLIDPLDDLFAALMLEVDVDIGRLRRSPETNLSNSSSCFAGSIEVTPRTKQTQLLAADSRPWQSIPRLRASRTIA
jgi:hypothetical protein